MQRWHFAPLSESTCCCQQSTRARRPCASEDCKVKPSASWNSRARPRASVFFFKGDPPQWQAAVLPELRRTRAGLRDAKRNKPWQAQRLRDALGSAKVGSDASTSLDLTGDDLQEAPSCNDALVVTSGAGTVSRSLRRMASRLIMSYALCPSSCGLGSSSTAARSIAAKLSVKTPSMCACESSANESLENVPRSNASHATAWLHQARPHAAS